MTETIGKRIFLDLDRCIGCKSCSAACFYGHQEVRGVSYAGIAEGNFPMICRQCEEPACVAACPVKALEKTESGAVRRSRLLCVGCLSCAQACPFGTIDQDLADGLISKCVFCQDRVTAGLPPRCVAACPAGALSFAVPDEIQKNKLLVLSARTMGHSTMKRR